MILFLKDILEDVVYFLHECLIFDDGVNILFTELGFGKFKNQIYDVYVKEFQLVYEWWEETWSNDSDWRQSSDKIDGFIDLIWFGFFLNPINLFILLIPFLKVA